MRVGRWITSEVRWDQSHPIPLSSHQAPKNYFATVLVVGFFLLAPFELLFFLRLFFLKHLGLMSSLESRLEIVM